MSQDAQNFIPKFGSFKPRATGIPDNAVQPHERLTGSLKGDVSKSAKDRPRRHHHERTGRQRRECREASSEHRGETGGETRRKSPALEVPEQIQFESDSFVVDWCGDPKNVEYGSLHRYSIPSYHRSGYGAVVGALPGTKIDREASTEKEIALRSSDGPRTKRQLRLLTTKNRQKLEPRGLRVVLPKNPSDALETQEYIQFESSSKRKRSTALTEQEVSQVAYRSIEPKERTIGHSEDEDLEYASDSDAGHAQNDLELRMRHQNAKLSKIAKDSPNDLSAWLDLLDHQRRIIGGDETQLPRDELRALAEIRLSIYRKALGHITKDENGRGRLLLGEIEDGRLVWETSKLATKWSEALKECPQSMRLWTKYLEFTQNSPARFRYGDCRRAYANCLGILNAAAEAAKEQARTHIGHAKNEVFLKMTTFMRDAGYDELAYGLWQLLLEYHFFRPTDVRNHETVLKSLEDFWESDIARIGEEGALGWKNFVANGEGKMRLPVARPVSRSGEHRPFIAFTSLEMETSNMFNLPASLNDELAEEDPFRHVMFSDMREALECMLSPMPDHLLINGFLRFMHCTPLPNFDRGVDGTLRTLDDLSVLSPGDTGVLPNRKHTAFTLFFDTSEAPQDETRSPARDPFTSFWRFTDRVLERLISARPGNDRLGEYYLAFKAHRFPTELPKAAKRLLRVRSSSLRLYNAYALAEAALGNLHKATEVWSYAARMGANLDGDSKDDLILVYHSWMLTDIRHAKYGEATHRMISFAGESEAAGSTTPEPACLSTGQRLAITRHLKDGFDRLRYKKLPGHAALCAECLAWLVYFAENGRVDLASDTIQYHTARLTSPDESTALELLHQAKACIIRNHTDSNRPYKPALLRREISQSLALFPENSLLLEASTRVGARNRIDDRLRDTVTDFSRGDAKAGLVAWSLALFEEMRRYSSHASGSTASSVRTLFSRALLGTESQVKHSPRLWRQWFNFEYSLIDRDNPSPSEAARSLQRAKQVFYHGLRHLPWCKSWVIEGLGLFARDERMGEAEMRQAFEVLMERELRIRSDMQDVEDL